MMRTIWKRRLWTGEQGQTVVWPHGARVIKVAELDAYVTLWADVDTNASQAEYKYIVRGSGIEVPEGAIYIGTSFDASFVWHVFEIKEDEQ